MKMLMCMLLDHPGCPPCVGRSEMEQKVDQMAAELTKRQLEREDTALQYKRYVITGWGMMMCCWMTLYVLLFVLVQTVGTEG